MLFIGSQTVSAESGKNNNDATPKAYPVITADESGTIDFTTSSAEWNKNVKITFGPTVITGDKLKVYFKKNTDSGISLNEDSISEVIITGNVKIVTEDGVATAQKAIYEAETKTLVLIGEPATLKSDKLDMACPKISFTGFDL
jgi:lipopolysaccharide export system protein LptA